jgi:DNA-directed RNA polymerase, mitochondrial
VYVHSIPLVTPGADPGSPAWFAAKWIELGIDRKITKRAVMTLPYGSTVFSCREFIEEALRTKLATKASSPFRFTKQVEAEGKPSYVETDGIFDASLFLQDHLWKAIGRVVQAAVVGMGWLRKCATLAAQEDLPIIWTLPDGFMVAQSYRETDMKRITSHLDGHLVQFRDYVASERIDKRRMANGIAPNWVHSLDAAALRAFVNLAHDQGIRSFGLVHDSYATVAADANMMSVCIRESFAQLYEDNDVMADFRSAIAAMLSDSQLKKLPPAPAKGQLDIALVRESDFFFA